MSLVENAVNTKEFRNKEDVREEEIFFQKFFKMRPEKVVEKDSEEDEENESFDEELDEFDDMDNVDFEEEDEPKKRKKTGNFVDADEFYAS